MQYIGIIIAVGVWAYFEFYRIPKEKEKLIYVAANTALDLIKQQWGEEFEIHGKALKGHKAAIEELQEDVTAIEQRFDIGNKQVPKAVSRN